MIINTIIDQLLRKQKSRDIQLCDSVAEKYALFDEQHPLRNPVLKKGIAKVVAEKRPAFILDLACGAGRYFHLLKSELTVGVDFSIGMLKQAKKFKNISLVRGDIFKLPFREKIFDLVISMSAIGEHCPLSVKLLKGIRKALSSTGTFAFTVIPLHHCLLPYKGNIYFMLPLSIMRFLLGKGGATFCASKFEVKNKLRKLGLEIVQIKEIHGSTTPHFFVVAYATSKERIKKD